MEGLLKLNHAYQPDNNRAHNPLAPSSMFPSMKITIMGLGFFANWNEFSLCSVKGLQLSI